MTASPRPGGWTVRIQRPDWGDDALEIDDRFSTLDDAMAWCSKMAATLVRDAADDVAE